MSVRSTGFNFHALREGTKRNIAQVLNEGVESGVSLAKQLALVDTGYMQSHIQKLEEATPDNLRASYESEADYSASVEYGSTHWWGDIDAQPFFTPAFESARHQVNNGLKRVLQFGGPRSL